jgi:hypothetical protein
MAWLWESWEEFVKYVQPVAVQCGRFQHACRATELELLGELSEAVRDLRKANAALATLGFDGKRTKQPKDEARMHEARNEVINAVYAGEALLLLHKRLTLNDASYGFLHAHDILEHWDRYAATTRIEGEIHQLTKDVDLLLHGYDRLVREDERLLIDELKLPEELTCDFKIARNLFSIGLDDIGLFLTGRGLEKVLRRIARDRKIVIVRKKPEPAEDAEFYDLIEALSRVRWKTRKVPLIVAETKALLHYLRSIRNRGAHKGQHGSEVEGAREKACVIAKTAARLWDDVHGNRAQLAPVSIPKDW